MRERKRSRRFLFKSLLLTSFGFWLALLWAGEPRMRADVYVWLSDGTVKRVSPDDGVYYQACINPDGTSVIFAGAETGPPRVWRVALPSGESEPITPAEDAAFLATYSWDGQAIVFSSDRAFDRPSVGVEEIQDPRLYRPGTLAKGRYRHFNLFVMDADGGNQRQVTHGRFRDLRATFSPDGERLAFYSSRRPRGPLWTTQVNGDEEPRVIPFKGEKRWDAFRPWYSRDGSELYFFGSLLPGPTRKRIAKVAVGGGEPRELPWDDQGKSQGPFVDPVRPALLFHTNRTGRSELWEHPLDGTPPRMLVPPGTHFPKDREVMHPTRSRNGVIAFDVSYREGGALRHSLQRVRARLGGLLRRGLGRLRQLP